MTAEKEVTLGEMKMGKMRPSDLEEYRRMAIGIAIGQKSRIRGATGDVVAIILNELAS